MPSIREPNKNSRTIRETLLIWWNETKVIPFVFGGLAKGLCPFIFPRNFGIPKDWIIPFGENTSFILRE
jgi:hypothetical protein